MLCNKKKCVAALHIVNIFWICVAALMIVANIKGYETRGLKGTSMEPALHAGDLAIITLDKSKIEIGDIIDFTREKNGKTEHVMHRLVKATEEGYITKGDNNEGEDVGVREWKDIKGSLVCLIPHMGFLARFTSSNIWIFLVGQALITMLSRMCLRIDDAAEEAEELERERLLESKIIQHAEEEMAA